MEVFVVYIREAHPWPRKTRRKGKTILPEPDSIEERANHAQLCVKHLKLSIPTLLDEMDNGVDKAYAALPDRLYIVGTDGRVAWKSKPGPFGFKPKDMEKAIRMLLGKWPGIL